MIAAIYARKSTDQSGVADEQKSVSRQIEHARAYAARKGWLVADEHVYVDDGISGVEFANRPGFLRLMTGLKPQPSFQILIMSEESRLGREAIETAYALKQLVTAGVRVFFHLEDRERTLNSPMEKAMLSLQAMADEMEREKARLRVTDAMLRKARAGHCCGGRAFGYNNVEILDPSGKRSHVERAVNPTEAAIVRRIFDLCAAGTGYTRIAKLLNAERAPAPRPKAGRLSGWAPSSVKEILDRRQYPGEIVWNRTQNCNTWGQKRPHARPQADWIQRSAPALRIVSDEQWHAAHGRLADTRERLKMAFGGMGSRQAHDIESKYLLSGFARCGVCGGGLGVMGGSRSSARGHVYGCIAYHKRGTSVCGNALKIPVARLDQAVLKTLAGDVLRPAVVMAVVDGLLCRLEPQAAGRDVDRQRAALQIVDREIGFLAQAISTGGELEPLLAELRVRQVRRDELLTAIAAYQRVSVLQFDRATIEQQIRRHLDRWHSLLFKHTAEGRQLLREVLAGPLRFTPEGRTYRFNGEAAVGHMLAGTAGLTTSLVAVRGIEPRSRG